MPKPNPPKPSEADPSPGDIGPRHVADEPVLDPDSPEATVQSPVTDTGLSVEDQVRKEWDPNKSGGLPVPLISGER